MSHLENWLVLLAVVACLPVVANAASPGESPFSSLKDDEAWARFPAAETGSGGPLPTWAKTLAGSLPKTTAAILELDLAQRTRSPLDPKLRAAMRWVAARSNLCAYSEAYAAFDARKAGMDVAGLEALDRWDLGSFSTKEKAALEFARKMTVESSRVTDAEFAGLVEAFGDRQVAAMVLLSAYANFQDRLLICLGAPLEEGGPTPPLKVAFSREVLASRANPAAPPKIADLPEPKGDPVVHGGADWTDLTYDQLQEKLEEQRAKPTRLKVPTWDEVKRSLPAGMDMKGTRVVWSIVAFGYVPELAAPWESVMWVNGAENGRRFDRVFGLSLFWVVTRSIDCPYCMGHCEMNWEVIGMTPAQIAARSRVLAGDDWSSFPPAEQRALAFARKLTRTPGTVSPEDIGGIVRDFGADPALSLLMYACRCNYMVRVSNGFQLSLERDNVFYDYYSMKPPEPARAESRR